MDFFEDINKWFKMLWIAGLVFTVAFWIFVIWVIIKILQHWRII